MAKCEMHYDDEGVYEATCLECSGSWLWDNPWGNLKDGHFPKYCPCCGVAIDCIALDGELVPRDDSEAV
jgi:hypothetical protein